MPELLVEDLQSFREALRSAGLAVVEDDALDGVARFHAEDPFGNRLEFIQSGDGFSERA